MYDVGDLAVFDNIFQDPETDVLVDPSSVVFKYENPSAVETTLTYPNANLVKLSTGKYRATVNLNASGKWNFRWETTGTYQGASEFSRTVNPTVF